MSSIGSLKAILKQRLVDDMILPSKQHSGDSQLVLCVDLHTSKIISSCMRMYDIMECGVVVIQNILLTRESLNDISAIYFITPTIQSINALCHDFTTTSKQYKSVYLYFTGRVKPDLLQLISTNKILVQYINAFNELNLDWIATESNVYTFNRTDSIRSLYIPSTPNQLQDEIMYTARQLVSLCLTLKEYPLVRYSKLGKSGINKALATFFDDDMKKQVSKLTAWRASESRDRGTLLIVDRTIDVSSALVHDIQYQSLINDLLRIKNELCYLPDDKDANTYTSSTISSTDQPNYVLSDDDTLWRQLRHQHINNVIQTIITTFREFKSKNVTAQFANGDNSNPTDVRSMIKVMNDMPQYKQMMSLYTKHINVAETGFKRFRQKNLVAIAELEQDIVTGLTESNTSANQRKLREQLIQFCTNNEIGRCEKLRLIALYIVAYGPLDDELRAQVLIDIPNELQPVLNTLTNKMMVDHSVQSNDKSRTHIINNDNLTLQRYTPYLHTVMSKAANYELDESNYPYIGIAPEGYAPQRHMRKQKNWKSNTNGLQNVNSVISATDIDDRPYIIIYVIGGVTYNEIRACYDIASKLDANIIIGSTNILTGNEFIRQLSMLNNNQFKAALTSGKRNDLDDEVESNDLFTNFDQITIDIPSTSATR